MAFISDLVDFTKSVDPTALQNKSALITGGASGIGAGIVRALAEAGVYVTIADLNAESGQVYAASLASHGYNVQFIQSDVISWPSQVSAFQAALSFSPTSNIDIVIACAGIAGAPMIATPPFTTAYHAADDHNPQPPDFQVQMINVNLIGPMYTATLAAHYWRQQPSLNKDNVLIFMASNIAYFPTPGFTGYTASKMGVRGLWKSLRGDPSFKGLFRTNLVAPHIVRTPMTKELQGIMEAMVEVEEVVGVLMRICCGGDIKGRAVQINPGVAFDLRDEPEGYDGSVAFQEHFTADVQAVFDMMDPSKNMS